MSIKFQELYTELTTKNPTLHINKIERCKGIVNITALYNNRYLPLCKVDILQNKIDTNEFAEFYYGFIIDKNKILQILTK